MGVIKTSKEASTPSTPDEGFCKLYLKSSGLYSLDENGIETKYESGAESGIQATITNSSSLDLDINTLDSLCAVEYIICMFNVTENKWGTIKMLATKKTGSDVEDTVYARIGEQFDVDFNFNIDGTDAKLVGTNNESFDVTVKIHKTLL